MPKKKKEEIIEEIQYEVIEEVEEEKKWPYEILVVTDHSIVIDVAGNGKWIEIPGANKVYKRGENYYM